MLLILFWLQTSFNVLPSNGSSDKPKERQILPKLSQVIGGNLPESKNHFTQMNARIMFQFSLFLPESPSCQYGSCVYAGRDHYHCTHPRCHFASERDDILILHIREFHVSKNAVWLVSFCNKTKSEQTLFLMADKHWHYGRLRIFRSISGLRPLRMSIKPSHKALPLHKTRLSLLLRKVRALQNIK